MDTLRRFISKIAPRNIQWKGVNGSAYFHFTLLLLSIVPLAFLSYSFFHKDRLLREGFQCMETLAKGAEKTARLRKKQAEQVRQYALADPLYLEKQIESYTPLSVQIENLTALIANEALSGCRYWESRLSDIIGEKNVVKFIPEEKKTFKNIQEQVLRQIMPVEIGNDDLQKLLAKIEGVKVGSYLPPYGRPDLIVKKFTLQRKRVGYSSEVFELDMELIKREGTRI